MDNNCSICGKPVEGEAFLYGPLEPLKFVPGEPVEIDLDKVCKMHKECLVKELVDGEVPRPAL